MKRIIPKPSKVRISFLKDLVVRDIVFASICLLITGLIAFSNLPHKYIFTIAFFLLSCSLFFFKVEERLYYELYLFFRFVFSKKKCSGSLVTAVKDVKNEYIEFKGGYFAGVLEVSSKEFFLLREENQDNIIDIFSCVFKNLTEGQKVSLIKLDRPVFLDAQVGELEKELKSFKGTEKLSQAKKYILEDRLLALKEINAIDKCCYYNAFYIVVYGTKSSVDSVLTQSQKEFTSIDLKTERLSDAKLVGFAKRTITQVFDERETSAIKNVVKYITPKRVRFKKKCAVVDDVVENTFVINRYPLETFNAWATALCNIDYTKVVINATPVNVEKAIKQLDRSAFELEEQYTKTGKISKRTETELHYQSLKYLVEELGNNNEVMLDVTASVTAYDYDKKGARFRREIKKKINKLGFRTSSMIYKQAEAFKISALNGSFDKKQLYSQGINSSSLGACFPFVASQIIEKNGIMIGENSMPVIVDFSKRDDNYKNSNIVVLGSVGSGKTFFAKTLFSNLLSKNYRLYVLDPENEYTILADNVGGKIIDMGSGGNIINPFAVLTDVAGDDNSSNLLLEHLTFLEEFFKITLDGISTDCLELCMSLLKNLYYVAGIDEKTDLKNFTGNYPTFDDFIDVINAYMDAEKKDSSKTSKYETLKTYLTKFAKGGRYSFLWNGQTNLNTNENFVVFNFQTLLSNANKTIASAQMLLLTQYLNNELIINYNKIKAGKQVNNIIIAIDEAHVFIDPNNPIALSFMKNTAKRCRKYGGMQVVMTQSVNDFLGSIEIERESKAVITESQYTFVFPLNASSTADFLKLYDKLDINTEEANEIMDNPRGTAFFIAHQRNRTSFRVVATPKVRELFEKQNVKIISK